MTLAAYESNEYKLRLNLHKKTARGVGAVLVLVIILFQRPIRFDRVQGVEDWLALGKEKSSRFHI